jgi:hypothetical protein
LDGKDLLVTTPRVCAPQLWNALPKHIRACDDFNDLTIKTVVFEEAFM